MIDADDTARAMKFCSDAGLTLRDRRIWQDRKKLAVDVKDETLKAWLLLRQSE